ncbi:MAG: HAMP domain-containing sensor histidine kinase [Coleofasciculaceae cyanobacterium]
MGKWQQVIQPQPISLLYRQWRDHLIRQRFWLAISLAVIYLTIDGLAGFYEVFINPEQLQQNLNLIQMPELLEKIRQNFILHKVVFISLLGCLILLWKAWGRKHPTVMLILIPWAIAFIPEMVLGAFFRIPRHPSTIMFLAQVVITPIHWRWHLIAQLVPISFYFLVYPLLGLATFAGQSLYSFSHTAELILICIICEVGVYLYEQSKQAEIEANRRLQLCIHSITHDLRTPVMGSLMLLQSIRQSTPVNQPSQLSPMEMTQLIGGSDRLLSLMNALLVPQALSQVDLVLHCQPTPLSAIIATILQDFHPSFVKQNIQINNQIATDLPLVEVDAKQIERVFNNLISNAISHNPPGLLLTLDAISIKIKQQSRLMLKVIVQDNGVGIPPTQQKTIFEPYTRGGQTQYLPGLGLGLYVCRQVVRAHGGVMGVESLDQGSLFWFTLPLSRV